MKMIRLLNFIKIVRLAKVIEESKKFKKIRKKNDKNDKIKKRTVDLSKKIHKEIEKIHRARRSTSVLGIIKGKNKISDWAKKIFIQNEIRKQITQGTSSILSDSCDRISKVLNDSIYISEDEAVKENKSANYDWVNPLQADFKKLIRLTISYDEFLERKFMDFDENSFIKSELEQGKASSRILTSEPLLERLPERKESDSKYINRNISHRSLIDMNNRKSILKPITTQNSLSEARSEKNSSTHLIGYNNIIVSRNPSEIFTEKINRIIFDNTGIDLIPSDNNLPTTIDKIFEETENRFTKMRFVTPILEEDYTQPNFTNNDETYYNFKRISVDEKKILNNKRKSVIVIKKARFGSLDQVNQMKSNFLQNKIFDDSQQNFNLETSVYNSSAYINDWGLKIAKSFIKCMYQSDKKLFQEQSMGEKLTESINRKVVLIIMLLLISLPILDSEYISSFLYTDDRLGTSSSFCIGSINTFFNHSLKNPSGLIMIKRMINSCISYTAEGQKYPILLKLIFSEYPLYQNMSNIYTNNVYSNYLPQKVYTYANIDHIETTMREGRDYQYKQSSIINDTEIYIQSYVNNIESSKLAAFIGLFRTLYISIVLIIASLIFTNDINIYVIKPIDIITAKLHLFIKNHDLIYKIDPLNIDIDAKSIVLLQNRENKMKDPNIKKLETYYIEKLIKRLIKLVSQSIGKPSNFTLF